MTYKEKYDALLVTANTFWETLKGIGHWENNTTAGHDIAFANWTSASQKFIDFNTQAKRDAVNMHDEMPLTYA